ncbi:MAG: hypothetical protein WCK39_10385 [Methanomassiliicoccales archaeon]
MNDDKKRVVAVTSPIHMYLGSLDEEYSSREGERKAELLSEASFARFALEVIRVKMGFMREFLLEGQGRSWWRAEREGLARLTLITVLGIRPSDAGWRKELDGIAGQLGNHYPWFITASFPEMPIGAGRERSMERAIHSTMAEKLKARGSDPVHHQELLLGIEEGLRASGPIDPMYCGELCAVLDVMRQEFARQSAHLPSEVRSAMRSVLDDPIGSDACVLACFVIDNLLLRLILTTPRQQIREEIEECSELFKNSTALEPISLVMAEKTFHLLANRADRGKMALRLAEIADNYAQADDTASALNIFDALIRNFEDRSEIRSALEIGKYCLMEKYGLDGLSPLQAAVDQYGAKGWHECEARGCAAMASILQAMGQMVQAGQYRHRMMSLIVLHRDDIQIWQQYELFMQTVLASQDLEMGLAIIAEGLASRADPQEMMPLWAEMTVNRFAIMNEMKELRSKRNPRAGKPARSKQGKISSRGRSS